MAQGKGFGEPSEEEEREEGGGREMGETTSEALTAVHVFADHQNSSRDGKERLVANEGEGGARDGEVGAAAGGAKVEDEIGLAVEENSEMGAGVEDEVGRLGGRLPKAMPIVQGIHARRVSWTSLEKKVSFTDYDLPEGTSGQILAS